MRKSIQNISIIISFVVLLTSVMQFHHHDCSGNICIHLTSFDDISNGFNNSHSDNCHDCDDHNNGHHDTEDRQECSMHIAEYKASKECKIINGNTPVFLYLPIEGIKALKIFESLIAKIYYSQEIILEIADCYFVSFRGPPIL